MVHWVRLGRHPIHIIIGILCFTAKRCRFFYQVAVGVISVDRCVAQRIGHTGHTAIRIVGIGRGISVPICF